VTVYKVEVSVSVSSLPRPIMETFWIEFSTHVLELFLCLLLLNRKLKAERKNYVSLLGNERIEDL